MPQRVFLSSSGNQASWLSPLILAMPPASPRTHLSKLRVDSHQDLKWEGPRASKDRSQPSRVKQVSPSALVLHRDFIAWGMFMSFEVFIFLKAHGLHNEEPKVGCCFLKLFPKATATTHKRGSFVFYVTVNVLISIWCCLHKKNLLQPVKY